MTRLPTLAPSMPFPKPGITPVPPTVKLNGRPGEDEDGQVELKTAPVRQIDATYCTTAVWPAVTTGPVPWMRVLVIMPVGGAVLGTLITGAVPVAAVTVGRVPPPVETWAPTADAVGLSGLIRSTTQTVVSFLVTPRLELPAVPYPNFGGRTASNWVKVHSSCLWVLPLHT